MVIGYIKNIPLTEKILDRFLSKIEKDPFSNCINWIASLSAGRVGQFKVAGKMLKAHRVSYVFFNGVLSNDLEINHKCRNPKCIAPDHLEALTREQHNIVDRDLITAGRRKLAKLKKLSSFPEGVSNNGKNYKAEIKWKGVKKYLGTFSTISQAAEQYNLIRNELEKGAELVDIEHLRIIRKFKKGTIK